MLSSTKPLKMTRQRQIILEELLDQRTHPTADQLFERVRRRLPRVSLGTIYRNLEQMGRAGMIHRLEVDGRQRRYDANLQPHWHVRCIRCDSVDDIFELPLHQLTEGVRSAHDYQIVGHRLEFLGICPKCR